jgi:Reverse transcriptase (RNA-dependent DNA polymerase)
MDDCTIAVTAITLINRFKAEITKHIEITDVGKLHWLLGIEIRCHREKCTIHLSQCSYINSILRCYNLQDLKPISTPMETNLKLSSSQSPATTAQFAQMRDVPYHEAIGSLMYASLRTRPDISFAVQTVSRFPHWEAVKRIFRYLKGTVDLWLSYGHAKINLAGYADADGSMAEDRHAISGYTFIIHGGAVSWSAKHQEIVSLSTTESEYVAATHAAKEALWL